MNKNAEISRRILNLVAAGASLPEAVDAVLGAGTFERVAAETFDALNARAAQTATKH